MEACDLLPDLKKRLIGIALMLLGRADRNSYVDEEGATSRRRVRFAQECQITISRLRSPGRRRVRSLPERPCSSFSNS